LKDIGAVFFQLSGIKKKSKPGKSHIVCFFFHLTKTSQNENNPKDRVVSSIN
jgi:hypothetical protein